MKRSTSNIILLSILVVYMLVHQLFILNSILKYAEFIAAAFIIVILVISITLLGFQKDKPTFIKRRLYTIIATALILYFAASYGLGLFMGFVKNAYSLSPLTILNNIFSPLIIIICTEIIRYVLIKANRDSKLTIILITFVLSLFEIFIGTKFLSLNTYSEIFKVVTSVILPIFMKNAVLSYLTYQVGYKPALVYRIVSEMYLFILPIIPDFSEYIKSMIGICLPFLIYIYSSRAINEYNNGIKNDFQKRTFQWTDIPVIIFIIVMVCLISGYFKFYIIGIGSNSMSPKINKGDAVILQKIDDKNDVKVGDVIAFEMDNKLVIHRLVEIEKEHDGNTYYRTRGDANNGNDKIDIKLEDIKGKVKIRIPYIAYPTIYLTEYLRSET